MTTRLFTPLLANQALPLVRRVVADILVATGHLQVEQKKSGGRTTLRLKELRRELEGYFEELQAIGCEYKSADVDVALVDFPSEIDGREVLLCWRSDEPEVAHYHEPDAGFSGRLPIPSHLLDSDGADDQVTPEPLGSERE